jgi:hypothetical protein
VFNTQVVPHFDNHPLADRSIFMDDNARPHRARNGRECRQQEPIETFQWPAMSADMNQVGNFISRKVNERNPQFQNIVDLTNAILGDCQ